MHAAKAQISQTSMGTIAETNTGNRTDIRCTAETPDMFRLKTGPSVYNGLTQSGEGCRCSSLPTEGKELLWQHGVSTDGHGARPEVSALLCRGTAVLCQLLKPSDGLQRESQSVLLQERMDVAI